MPQPPLPFALHPDNPHYFLFRGEPTILITSAEHYGAVINLDFDFVRYFDALQADGLNHTRVWTGTYREIDGPDIERNTLAPAANRFVCPWARSEKPGYFDGGNRFDLERWDPGFFDRLGDFMREASRRGIVVEINLFCPFYNDGLWKANPMFAANNVQGIGACELTDVFALKDPQLTRVQEAAARKIVTFLAEFDNLYFEVCNEPYFGGVTLAWQHHIADVIVDAEKALPHKHLISMNIANGAAHVEQPHAGVSIFNFHYCTPPDAVATNFHLNKPIGENETGFRGKADAVYRSEAWDFLLAGGATYNNLDFSFTCAHPDGSDDVQAPGGGSAALRGQLSALKKFLYGFDFIRMAPDDAIIKGGVPADGTGRVLAERGRQYAVYLKFAALGNPGGWPGWKEPDPIRIDHVTQTTLQSELPAGTYHAQWINPMTGEIEASESIAHPGGIAAVRSPSYREDIAVSIRSSQGAG